MREIRSYLSALWLDVVARMSGIASLLFTGGGTYSHHFEGTTGASHAQTFWWLAAVVCGVIASYRVWVAEHKKVLSQLPDFVITLEHVNWWYQQDTNDTMLIIAVSMTNKGAASAAFNWRGDLIVGGIRETLQAIHITDRWLIPSPNPIQEPVVIFPDNQIISKTVEGCITRGEAKNGRLFLLSKGDKRRFLESLNWTLEVFCNDFLARPSRGSFQPHPAVVPENKIYPGERRLTPDELKEVMSSNDTGISRGAKSSRKVRGGDEEVISIPKARQPVQALPGKTKK